VLRKTSLAFLMAFAASAGAANAQSGEDVTRTPVGDWTRLCVDGGEVCVIEQIGRTSGGEEVLNFQVEKLPSPQQVNGASVQAVANIRVPLGVVLTQGLRLKIDQGETSASPYFVCQQAGCLVRAPLQEALLNSLRRGAKATLSFTVIQNGEPQEITTDLSLSGFTRAFGDL
jgi:invasion protein IalB